MDRVLWMGGQAFSWWVYLWPISLTLVVGVALSFVRTWRRGKPLTRRHAWLLLPALAIPLLLLVGGALEGHSEFSALLLVIVAAQFVLSVSLVVTFGDVRLLAVALCLCWLWMAACCAIVAQMALTDLWL